MYKRIVMDSIKTSALASTAILALLALLAIPEFFRDESRPGDAPAANSDLLAIDPQPRLEHERADSTEPDATPLIERNLPFPADRPVATQAQGWSSTPYQALDLIAELENQPADTAISELLPMLYQSVAAIRLAAIQSLGDMTTRAALPALTEALKDREPRLRIAALEALASHGDSSTVGSIEYCLLDSEPDVRMAAIEVLAELESEIAMHSLAGLLSDQDVMIRRHAINALGEIGGVYAMMYLLRARYDPETEIRVLAEAVLTELEYETAN